MTHADNFVFTSEIFRGVGMTSLTHKRVNNGKMRAQRRKMISDLKSQANSEQNEPNLFLRVSSPLSMPSKWNCNQLAEKR